MSCNLCFCPLRFRPLEGFILSTSHQSENRPDLLCDIHSECRTGLLGCHFVPVCYGEGDFLSFDKVNFSFRKFIKLRSENEFFFPPSLLDVV